MPVSGSRGRSLAHGLLYWSALVILVVTTLVAVFWPRQQVGQSFVPGGGNVVVYDDHELLRVILFVTGVVIAGVLRVLARRRSANS